ncbi:MAG: hypothetical protein K0S74_701 [Chlamydiales bacterium]|jgi:hypothetical protein|nr:hypothetical protein [Chlamydiales bacterium]
MLKQAIVITKKTLEESLANDFKTGKSFPSSNMVSMDVRIANLKLKYLFQHLKHLEINPIGQVIRKIHVEGWFGSMRHYIRAFQTKI